VVLDEVDKIGNSTNAPLLPVLLDLLESRSAKCFRDVFFGMEFDCSRMIFILTANSIETVPTPLLSRVNVFDVPRPAPDQRLRIIKREIQQWQNKTRHPEITFDMNGCHELAERVDLDLRKTTDLVREGFGRAISGGATLAKLSIPKNQVRSIGF
jgi:ATP-dependent Lon protease